VKKYSIGLDFGTESLRALLVALEDGEEVAEEVYDYPDGVIDQKLPCKEATPLEPDWFLQNPRDYLTGIETVIPGVLKRAGVEGSQVVGVGLDFTACTLLPTDENGTPLCFMERHRADPQAWVKLWKHHGAAAEAEEVIKVARERGERFLDYSSRTISSEWLMPKALEMIHRSPDIYEKAYTLVEGADWIPWQLTGKLARNACCAGYKACYVEGLGWPSEEFLAQLDPALATLYAEKLPGELITAGSPVGGITKEWADKLGLAPRTAVSAAMIDGHMGVLGSGVAEPHRMVLVMGTSFCYMMLAEKEEFFEGVTCMVKDGIVPGYWGYESGQAGGGDVYAWFVNNCVPASYEGMARREDVGLHELLSREAKRLAPGETGLLALDWWNGNRSILMDAELSGLLVGATLNTKPEEIYRALIEATAFGARRILQSYLEAGMKIDELVACGGLPHKNPVVMQIFSDVLNRPITVAASRQTVALGSAICGAVAAGRSGGRFESIQEGVAELVRRPQHTYTPEAEAAAVYDELYEQYRFLHDTFGRRERLMHRLRAMKARQRERRQGRPVNYRS